MEEKVLPSRIPLGPAIVITNLNEDQFLDYVRKGYIEYGVSQDDEVYLTESMLVDFFCFDWDEGDRPNTLTDLPEFVSLESSYPEIEAQAEREIDTSDIEGYILNEIDDGEIRKCQVCGKADLHSKGLCQKHYNKINYRYDEVSKKTIQKFRRESEAVSGWSRKYSACRLCGETDNPHHAQGYCTTCYQERYRD